MPESELIDLLARAQRGGTNSVDATQYAQLDRPAAYRVQTGVMAALGQGVGMLKTAIHADGVGVVAPIYADRVGPAGSLRLASVNVVGLEVEVGLVLGRTLPGAASEAEVRAAVDHYFLGVEICGSRFADRKAAGPNGGLADNMSALAYAIGPRRASADEIDGLTVRIALDDRELYAADAKHGFGTVLASLVAYSASQQPAYPLTAGTIITTGSMCGLVATSGPGHVLASFGGQSLEFDLV